MAKLGGGDFASGAAGAGFNQMLMNELARINDPALHQCVSALVGAIAAKLVGGNAKSGASTAVSETKNNFYGDHYISAWKIVYVQMWKVDAVIAKAEVINQNAADERYVLDFGDGDKLEINTGHGYRDTHKSQTKGGAPPLTGSPKENYIKAIASAVLINHANKNEYPILGTPGDRYKEITTNMLIYNSDTGKNEYILLGIHIGRHPETGNLQVTTFYPIVKI